MSFFLLFCLLLGGQTLYGLEIRILSPGEKTAIPRPPDHTVRLGNKKILHLEQKGEKLIILARSQGESLLLAGGKRYRFLILEPEKKEQALLLSQGLQTLRGLKWVFLEQKQSFQIQGQLSRFSDWLELARLSKKHNIKYEFKAKMDEELKQISFYYFKQLLQKPFKIFWKELPLVSFPKGSPLLLSQKLLSPFGLIPQEQENWFFKAPFVQIEWALVESLSSSSLSVGALVDKDWPSFGDFLNFLKSSGWAKSQQNSFAVVQSGKSIRLESGGQIPFTQYNFKTEQESLNWKSYGWNLQLSPTLDIHRQIHLKVRASISEPLFFPSSSASPVPLKNQNIETDMVLSALKIVKLFEWKKHSRGRHYGGRWNFLPGSPKALLGGPSRYKSFQSLFLQIRILEDKKPAPNKGIEQ